jgi:hypothetical protein
VLRCDNGPELACAAMADLVMSKTDQSKEFCLMENDDYLLSWQGGEPARGIGAKNLRLLPISE